VAHHQREIDMQDDATAATIVVAVDGSQAANHAVRWATEEAAGRRAALRIVYAAGVEQPPVGGDRREIDAAEQALRSAAAVAAEVGESVAVQTDILWGPVSVALIDESKIATMLCVGAVGADGHPGEVLGTTAAALAESAHCPLAIIRDPRGGQAGGIDWIVVAVNDHPDNGAVIECTLAEARLRKAPVLAVGVGAEDLGENTYHDLDLRIEKWKLGNPDIRIHGVASVGSLGQFLESHAEESVQLAVLGENDVDQIAYLVWSRNHSAAPRGERSILVVPHPMTV
jgi:nucleotide-binding universal stress UspA family protein